MNVWQPPFMHPNDAVVYVYAMRGMYCPKPDSWILSSLLMTLMHKKQHPFPHTSFDHDRIARADIASKQQVLDCCSVV